MYRDEVSLSINIIENNLQIGYPTKEIIDKVNIRNSQFTEIFKFYSGYTTKQYQRKRIMSEATEELIKGTKLIDVALKFGYGSPEAFSRAFKNEFNFWPSDLKEKNINIELFERLSDEIINEKSKLIEDFNFSGSKEAVTKIKEILRKFNDLDLFQEYSFSDTTHLGMIKINIEKMIEYLESFDEIILPKYIYDVMTKATYYKQEDLETVLALIYLSTSEQYFEDFLLKGEISTTLEEISAALLVIDKYYDMKNPRLTGSNYHFGLNKSTRDTIDTLKLVR